MSDDAVPMRDDPDAPVIFADELTGGGSMQNNVNLVFSVLQYDYAFDPPRPYRRVCLRLVLPKTAADRAALFISGAVSRVVPDFEAPPFNSALH